VVITNLAYGKKKLEELRAKKVAEEGAA